ncbi:hypothetical protein F4815DRAFT_14599 [Daldinia loculata]|nr:hypothetical protein F4815DRAFT_14599 [Daldinia loculata]
MAEVALQMGVWMSMYVDAPYITKYSTKEGDPARLASDSTDNARAVVRSEVF